VAGRKRLALVEDAVDDPSNIGALESTACEIGGEAATPGLLGKTLELSHPLACQGEWLGQRVIDPGL
jgi:hypothetical protein